MENIKEGFTELDDIKISFSECGKGKNIIFLHGNSEDKSIFRKYQVSFFQNYHTFALDSRGHGKSISDDKEYTINKYSDDVIGFCEKMNIKETYVVGYSDGGNISLFLALKRPDIFKKIVAISPNYLVSGTEEKWLKIFRHMKKDFTFLKKIGINTSKWIMRFDLMLNDIGINEEDMRTIKTNMRFLYAEKEIIREDHIKEIASFIKDSSIRKIDKCTHMSILKKEDTVTDIQKYFE